MTDPQSRTTSRLTAEFVRSVSVEYGPDGKPRVRRFSDGRRANGLALHARASKHAPGGVARSWVQTIRLDGRETTIGIGTYPDVTLKAARARAAENVRTRSRGEALPYGLRTRRARDATRAAANTITFASAAERTIASLRETWTIRKHPIHGPSCPTEKAWRGVLSLHVLPAIGDMLVSEVTQRDVLAFLAPIWSAKPTTAREARQRTRAVFAWAVSAGYCTMNPAGDVLDGALPKVKRNREHRDALPYADVAGFITNLRAVNGNQRSAALAVEFTILTGARSCEVTEMRWDEIDEDARAWTVPASRMKMRRAHRVPLSDAALDVLARAKAEGGFDVFVFKGRRPRSKLAEDGMRRIMRATRDAGDTSTVHGFRSSFRNWGDARGDDGLLLELCLAHDTRSLVEAAYSRSDMLERRRPIMQAWGEFVVP